MRNDQQYDWFYKKPAWRKIREMALSRDDYLCQHCFDEGVFKQADLVHHIVYVENDFNKALSLENLVSLCHACHNEVHKNDNKRHIRRNSRKYLKQKQLEKKKINIIKLK